MGLEHIETQVVSSSTGSVDFTNVFDGSADRYILYVDNFKPASDGGQIWARFSSDGGSTWDSGTSDYAYSWHSSLSDGTTSSGGSGGSSEVGRLTQSVGTGSTDVGSVKAVIHHPEDSNRATVIRGRGIAHRAGANTPWQASFNGGERLTQSAIDSIQLFDGVQNGDIASGIFSVYAVTETSAGAKDHIETIEANSQSSVDFTNVFGGSDGYDRYEIHCDNVISANDGVQFNSRFSSDGGSTWDSGTSDYTDVQFRVQEDGTSASSSGSGDLIRMASLYLGNDSANNDTFLGKYVISEPTNSNCATLIRGSVSMRRNSFTDPYVIDYNGGIRLTQSAIDSIQFFMSSGNIDSGTFSVYGIGQ